MALSSDVMGSGFSAGQAHGLGGNVNLTVSAAGTTQATATAIKTSNVYVSTAAASSGVILPATAIGRDSVFIYNGGANPVTIYPPVGWKINQLATNAGFLLAVNTACLVKRFSSTQFIAFLSA